MENLVAKIEVKFRISGIDPTRPRKQTHQHFETYDVNTPVMTKMRRE